VPIEAISKDALDATQEELKEQLLPKSHPRIMNTEAIQELAATVRYWHRERPYLILPVSFRLGAELQKLRLAITELSGLIEDSESASDDLADLSQKAIVLIWKHSVPEHPMLAIKKKFHLLRNPLRDATDGEVLDLVNFFLRRRMLSSFRAK
jgi:hypothetical protein